MSLTNRFILVTLCFFLTNKIKAQSVATFDVSQVVANFKFVDSNGELDKSFTPNITNSYSLGFLKASDKGVLLGGNIGLRMAGASKQVNSVAFKWNFQYLDLKVGAGYILNKWRIKPYVLVSPYYASLLKADQLIAEKTYDVKKAKGVLNYDFGVVGSAGVKIKLSDLVSLFSSYNHIYGIKNIEVATNQKLYNRGFSLSLGIALTISKTSPRWIRQ
jgi:hypothetical protein